MKSEPLEAALGIDSEGTPAPAEEEDAVDDEQGRADEDAGPRDADNQVTSVVGESPVRLSKY